MDSSWTCLTFIAALFFVTVTSDCGKNGCGGGGGGGGRGGAGSSYSSYSRSSSYSTGPSRSYSYVRTVPVRADAHFQEQSGPGWQASYRVNADGSWNRQSSWNSNAGYSSSKAALSGFHTRGGGGTGGMVREVVRTGGGGGGGGGAVVNRGTGGGVVTEVVRTRGGGGGGGRGRGAGGRRGGGGAGGGAAGGRVVTTTSCTDTLTTPQQITGYKNRVVGTVRSCGELVRDYPSLCRMTGSIGGSCCRSCSGIGTGGAGAGGSTRTATRFVRGPDRMRDMMERVYQQTKAG